MPTLQETEEIGNHVYVSVASPISILGIISNLFIVVVWSRERYHPTRFLLMVMMVGQSLTIILLFVKFQIKLWDFLDESKTSRLILILIYFPRYIGSHIELLAVVTHGLWLTHTHKALFFSWKCLTVEAAIICAWSVLLRVVNVSSQVARDTVNILRLRIAFDFIGTVLPHVLQLLVLVVVVKKQRSFNSRVARGEGPPADGNGLSQDEGEDEAEPAVLCARRTMGYSLDEENRLTKALTIMSLISLFLRVVPLNITFYFRAPRTLHPARHLAEAVRVVSLAIDHSCHIVYFPAIFPSLSVPFQRLYSRLCCLSQASEAVGPLTESTFVEDETPVAPGNAHMDKDRAVSNTQLPGTQRPGLEHQDRSEQHLLQHHSPMSTRLAI